MLLNLSILCPKHISSHTTINVIVKEREFWCAYSCLYFRLVSICHYWCQKTSLSYVFPWLFEAVQAEGVPLTVFFRNIIRTISSDRLCRRIVSTIIISLGNKASPLQYFFYTWHTSFTLSTGIFHRHRRTYYSISTSTYLIHLVKLRLVFFNSYRHYLNPLYVNIQWHLWRLTDVQGIVT